MSRLASYLCAARAKLAQRLTARASLPSPAAQAAPCSKAALRAARARLADVRGFMLAEQLATVAFVGLLCVAAGAGLCAALASQAGIVQQTRADTMLAQTVEVLSDELAFSQGKVTIESGRSSAVFYSATTNSKVRLKHGSQGIVLETLTDAGQSTGEESLIMANGTDMKPTFSLSFTEDEASGASYWKLTVMIVPSQGAGTKTFAMAQDVMVRRVGC